MVCRTEILQACAECKSVACVFGASEAGFLFGDCCGVLRRTANLEQKQTRITVVRVIVKELKLQNKKNIKGLSKKKQ